MQDWHEAALGGGDRCEALFDKGRLRDVAVDPDSDIDRKMDCQMIANALLNTLKPRRRCVLEWRFGVASTYAYSLDEVTRIHPSGDRMYVRAIEVCALQFLQRSPAARQYTRYFEPE